MRSERFRSWMLVAYPGHTPEGTSKSNWFPMSLKALNVQPCEHVTLILMEPREDGKQFHQIFDNLTTVKMPQFDESLLESVIAKNKINTFFSHGAFTDVVLKIRYHLMTKHFQDVLCIWNANGFLRPARGDWFPRQFDWLGWNALSSLAYVDIEDIPEINAKENEFLESFMKTYLKNKISESSRIVQSKKDLQSFVQTDKPIVFIPLQLETDSVVKYFTPKQYHDLRSLFNLSETFDDYYFIIKDHPDQKKGIHTRMPTKGDNYSYLQFSELDTITTCIHSDVVLCLNSTVGFESLYWTPVIPLGRTTYNHSQISYSLENLRQSHFPSHESDIRKFLHYAVKTFHFIQGINTGSIREWMTHLEHSKNEAILNRQLGDNFAQCFWREDTMSDFSNHVQDVFSNF